MKKVIRSFAMGVCAALVLGTALGFSACETKGAAKDKVLLKALPSAQAVNTMEADYFLLAEPAVTAQAKNGFAIKGDLQALYGGEKGYPQAVLVAKTELLTNYAGWVENYFINKLVESAEWLQTASGAEVVAAVSAHAADNYYATSLNPAALTAEAMGRCGVWFTHAAESKTETTEFLAGLRAVNPMAVGTPTDEFFWQGAKAISAVYPSESEVTVCMPDGAPALALAKMMYEDTADDGVTYKVYDPSVIASVLTYQDQTKNADLCVLPVTAASKLVGNGERYKMVGVVTHGNLYLIAKDGETLTAENMLDLKGKSIGVLKINEVPGLTLKGLLNKYGVPFEEEKIV